MGRSEETFETLGRCELRSVVCESKYLGGCMFLVECGALPRASPIGTVGIYSSRYQSF